MKDLRNSEKKLISINIIMEKCKCDVKDALNGNCKEYTIEPLNLFERFFMFLNMVTAVELLNHFQIIHTDLNFRNIFIIENHRFAVKIGDLGFSIKMMDDKKT
jgi:hypothetical protein